MIETKFIEIKVSRRNINDIKRELKDNNLKISDNVTLPISFLSEGSHYQISCLCDKCGKRKKIMYQKYIKNIKNGGYYSCSSKCSQEKVRNTSNERYGEDYYTKTKDYIISVKNTNLEKYNSEFYLTSDLGKSIINKIMISKYGVFNPFDSSDIQNQIKETNIEKWGVDNPSKTDKIKNKISKSNRISWSNKFKNYYIDNHDLEINEYNNLTYKINCKVCKSDFIISRFLLSNRILIKTTICTLCNPINSSSGKEKEIQNFIKEIYQGNIIFNTKKYISPLELDIYLPDEKLAIEFNGLYWHSDIHKEKDYHHKKWKLCKDIGINLLQVWEDDWFYKKEIVQSIIKNRLNSCDKKIYARKCQIEFIDNKSSLEFLKENHLKGKINSKIRIGLIFDGIIVSVMTFDKLRKSLGHKNDGKSYEMVRFCVKRNYSVIGGASKLFKFFIKNFDPETVISYHDNSLGLNSFYEKIGFKSLDQTPIDYCYVDSGIRIHRYNLRKDNLIKMGYNKEETELEITKKLKITRIFGSGNTKFIYTRN